MSTVPQLTVVSIRTMAMRVPLLLIGGLRHAWEELQICTLTNHEWAPITVCGYSIVAENHTDTHSSNQGFPSSTLTTEVEGKEVSQSFSVNVCSSSLDQKEQIWCTMISGDCTWMVCLTCTVDSNSASKFGGVV